MKKYIMFIMILMTISCVNNSKEIIVNGNSAYSNSDIRYSSINGYMPSSSSFFISSSVNNHSSNNATNSYMAGGISEKSVQSSSSNFSSSSDIKSSMVAISAPGVSSMGGFSSIISLRLSSSETARYVDTIPSPDTLYINSVGDTINLHRVYLYSQDTIIINKNYNMEYMLYGSDNKRLLCYHSHYYDIYDNSEDDAHKRYIFLNLLIQNKQCMFIPNAQIYYGKLFQYNTIQ